MMQNTDNFKRGTVELIVLSVLSQKDMYGYELVKTISEKSNKNFELPLGTLYPVLYRFVENGLISDRDEVVNKRLRKYYHLEEKGKEYLKNNSRKNVFSIYQTFSANKMLSTKN